MPSHDQLKTEEVHIESICHLSDQEQADLIADTFYKVSNEYDPIDTGKSVWIQKMTNQPL